jgi:hypothetical protein
VEAEGEEELLEPFLTAFLTRLWEEVAVVLKSLEQEEELVVGELLVQIWKRLLKL